MNELALLAAISIHHQIIGVGRCRCGYTYDDERLYEAHIDAVMADAGAR